MGEYLSAAELESLDNHVALWRAYVRPDADPTEMELWGAVRSAVDYTPKLLAEVRALREKAEALDALESHLFNQGGNVTLERTLGGAFLVDMYTGAYEADSLSAAIRAALKQTSR